MVVKPSEMRPLVYQLLAKMTRDHDATGIEFLLIANERYLGHRYRYAGFTADWIISQDRILIRNRTGRPMRDLSVDELLPPPTEKRAA